VPPDDLLRWWCCSCRRFLPVDGVVAAVATSVLLLPPPLLLLLLLPLFGGRILSTANVYSWWLSRFKWRTWSLKAAWRPASLADPPRLTTPRFIADSEWPPTEDITPQDPAAGMRGHSGTRHWADVLAPDVAFFFSNGVVRTTLGRKNFTSCSRSWRWWQRGEKNAFVTAPRCWSTRTHWPLATSHRRQLPSSDPDKNRIYILLHQTALLRPKENQLSTTKESWAVNRYT